MPQTNYDPLDEAREWRAVEATDLAIWYLGHDRRYVAAWKAAMCDLFEIAKRCVWSGTNGECEHWWSQGTLCTSHSLRDCAEHVPVKGCWMGYAGAGG